MKKMILKIYTWLFWKHFLCGLKSVLGHKTLASSIKEMYVLENRIRGENGINPLTIPSWDNSKKTSREIFAKYITLKHFNDIGKILVFFRGIDKKRIENQEVRLND